MTYNLVDISINS